jgi:hypothetical protein
MKFARWILPGRVYEKLDGPQGYKFMRHVEGQLKHIIDEKQASGRR